jgi:hypothetical protein
MKRLTKTHFSANIRALNRGIPVCTGDNLIKLAFKIDLQHSAPRFLVDHEGTRRELNLGAPSKYVLQSTRTAEEWREADRAFVVRVCEQQLSLWPTLMSLGKVLLKYAMLGVRENRLNRMEATAFVWCLRRLLVDSEARDAELEQVRAAVAAFNQPVDGQNSMSAELVDKERGFRLYSAVREDRFFEDFRAYYHTGFFRTLTGMGAKNGDGIDDRFRVLFGLVWLSMDRRALSQRREGPLKRQGAA